MPGDVQGERAGLQAPIEPHTPPVQASEQHSDAFPQSWPSFEHPAPAAHSPPAHVPEQQPPPALHAPPLAVHAPAPQMPPVHCWTQHCDGEVQASPVVTQGPPAALVDELLLVDVPPVELLAVELLVAELLVEAPPLEPLVVELLAEPPIPTGG